MSAPTLADQGFEQEHDWIEHDPWVRVVDGEFGFTVRVATADWNGEPIRPPAVTVYLSHQCDEWLIAGPDDLSEPAAAPLEVARLTGRFAIEAAEAALIVASLDLSAYGS